MRLERESILKYYRTVRQQTIAICEPLEIEDYVIQGIEDVSPPKWHLAHTTWFFETMILIPYIKQYKPFHPLFHTLFNSYYQALGQPYPRPDRGLLSRPTVETIYAYRKAIDERIEDLLLTCDEDVLVATNSSLVLGLHHEQQHQELLLMDVKYNYSLNPDFPVYRPLSVEAREGSISAMHFTVFEGGMVSIGAQPNTFSYDNENPLHQQFIYPYTMANRLVTNGEYLEFIEAGGYQNAAFWLSEGWHAVLNHRWQAPLYWYQNEHQWYQFTLHGLTKLDVNEPVVHISFYEADAYARWCKKRLPTEIEWEHGVMQQTCMPSAGNLLEVGALHPLPNGTLSHDQGQFFGDVWEWTGSPYIAYPGYRTFDGALREYNGKFMSGQMVLRGGSCVTPLTHIRASYRNFFHPDKRWVFTGIRLANFTQ